MGSLYRDIAKGWRADRNAPGRAVDVRALLGRSLVLWGRPVAVVADRCRETDLVAALEASGFPSAVFIRRGQGYKDGSEDVRGFRRAVLEDRVEAGRSLLLRAAFVEATTVSDPAGNEKLAKGCQGGRRQRARDDAAAAVLAVAEGMRRTGRRRSRVLRDRGGRVIHRAVPERGPSAYHPFLGGGMSKTELRRELQAAVSCLEEGNWQGVANCVQQAKLHVLAVARGTDHESEVRSIFDDPGRSYPSP